MLISFSVSNFRSFGEEQTLNMVASNKLTDHPEHRVPIRSTGKHVLRAAVIYGANAAGKSNLIRAMRVAQQLILESGERPPGVEPFCFDRERLGQPSSFEFRFLLGERVFVFGFDVTSTQIIGEWLAVLSNNGDELPIFERDVEGVTKIGDKSKRLLASDTTMFATLTPLAQLPVKNTQLFLNRVRSLPEASQGATLGAVVRWLTQDLVILKAQHRVSDIVNRLYRDATFRSFSSQFLQSVGTGIGELGVEEDTRELGAFNDLLKSGMVKPGPFLVGSGDTEFEFKGDPDHFVVRRLVAAHNPKGEPIPLPFSEESDGTEQLLHLMPVLSPAEENKVFVIDELDRSLHPLLTWEFIRFFSESLPGVRKQLIVTTHEVHLLNQELLRRDEYWFVEKDAAQQSRLVSLSDFNIRNDLQVEKGYLQGRFGAIPVIGAMGDLEKLLKSPGTEAKDAPQDTSA
jgi:AAA15 family ATPase/GTPase